MLHFGLLILLTSPAVHADPTKTSDIVVDGDTVDVHG